MKLDYFTTAPPWPENSGARLRVNALTEALERQGCQVRLIVLGEKPSRPVLQRIRDAGGLVYPGRIGTSGARLRRYLLGVLGGPDPLVAQLFNARRLSQLAQRVAERGSDVVLLGNVYLAPLLPVLERAVPGARIIIDNHNVESLLHQRLAARGAGLRVRVRAAVVARTSQRLEQRYLSRASQVWACSDEDARHFKRAYQLPRAFVVPNGVDTQAFAQPASAGNPAQPAVVFTGSFWYPPNQHAACVLIELSERLAAGGLPHRLYLVGQAPTPRMARRARRHPGVIVTGAVPDVRPYLSGADVFAAPLAAGSGTKLKLLQAMAMGLAVVTTPIGAEGLRLADGTHALVARDARAFEGHLARLLVDPEQRARLGRAARAHVERHFSLDAIARAVADPLQQLGLEPA